MSKRINVNPDHYKVKGRERPGDDVPAEQEKQQYSKGRPRGQARPGGGTLPPGTEKPVRKKK